MSEFDWNKVFRLPEAALAGNRRIPKTVLSKQASLTKVEQRKLDKVKRLLHFATVQKSTTRIPPYADEERDIQSILFLQCEMAIGSTASTGVAELVHACFPNPTVLLFEAGGDVEVSVSLMRKNLAEQGATVVERIESTGLFNLAKQEYLGFLEALAFEDTLQDNLWRYLLDLAGAVKLARSVDELGFYPRCHPQNRERLFACIADFDKASTVVKQLKEQRRARDTTLNESAKLRVRIKEEERRLQTVANEIREICNDGY